MLVFAKDLNKKYQISENWQHLFLRVSYWRFKNDFDGHDKITVVPVSVYVWLQNLHRRCRKGKN